MIDYQILEHRSFLYMYEEVGGYMIDYDILEHRSFLYMYKEVGGYMIDYQILEHRSFFYLYRKVAGYILDKSENATLQLSIFYEKVLAKKNSLKLNIIAQTSSKRFIETPPLCLV